VCGSATLSPADSCGEGDELPPPRGPPTQEVAHHLPRGTVQGQEFRRGKVGRQQPVDLPAPRRGARDVQVEARTALRRRRAASIEGPSRSARSTSSDSTANPTRCTATFVGPNAVHAALRSPPIRSAVAAASSIRLGRRRSATGAFVYGGQAAVTDAVAGALQARLLGEGC